MAIKFTSLSALALALVVGQAPTAFADHHEGMKKGDWVLHVAEKLDLTTEQKVKVKMYADKAKMEVNMKQHDMSNLRVTVNEAFKSGAMTDAKVDEFAGQEQQLIGAVIKARLQERFNVYSILTDKQKEKMNEMTAKWAKKHME
jgi:Spy/CpxP family protein refolding chaperone